MSAQHIIVVRTTKGGAYMSPKAGRPFSENPKAERLYIRVTAEEKKRIMVFCDEHKVSALDLIRKGMDAIKK